jgi:hypothetical protein
MVMMMMMMMMIHIITMMMIEQIPFPLGDATGWLGMATAG